MMIDPKMIEVIENRCNQLNYDVPQWWIESTSRALHDAGFRRVHIEHGCKCPVCGSHEIDAMTARTIYDCGSSDYDARPGTFRQSDKCSMLANLQESKHV